MAVAGSVACAHVVPGLDDAAVVAEHSVAEHWAAVVVVAAAAAAEAAAVFVVDVVCACVFEWSALANDDQLGSGAVSAVALFAAAV